MNLTTPCPQFEPAQHRVSRGETRAARHVEFQPETAASWGCSPFAAGESSYIFGNPRPAHCVAAAMGRPVRVEQRAPGRGVGAGTSLRDGLPGLRGFGERVAESRDLMPVVRRAMEVVIEEQGVRHCGKQVFKCMDGCGAGCARSKSRALCAGRRFGPQ
jgi:hypothetical protein